VRSKVKSKGARSKKTRYGLSPKHYPRNIRERVDYDYIDDLPPDAQEWLAKFNERYYGADFRGDPDGEWSKEERRKSYAAKNAVNTDAYSIGACVDGAEPIDSRGLADLIEARSRKVEDWSNTPAYLDHPVYKAAVAELRAVMATRKRPSLTTPEQAKDYEHRVRVARAKLEDAREQAEQDTAEE
jgi:hypothetical protein